MAIGLLELPCVGGVGSGYLELSIRNKTGRVTAFVLPPSSRSGIFCHRLKGGDKLPPCQLLSLTDLQLSLFLLVDLLPKYFA
jgi:hypothetical protein